MVSSYGYIIHDIYIRFTDMQALLNSHYYESAGPKKPKIISQYLKELNMLDDK